MLIPEGFLAFYAILKSNVVRGNTASWGIPLPTKKGGIEIPQPKVLGFRHFG